METLLAIAIIGAGIVGVIVILVLADRREKKREAMLSPADIEYERKEKRW